MTEKKLKNQAGHDAHMRKYNLRKLSEKERYSKLDIIHSHFSPPYIMQRDGRGCSNKSFQALTPRFSPGIDRDSNSMGCPGSGLGSVWEVLEPVLTPPMSHSTRADPNVWGAPRQSGSALIEDKKITCEHRNPGIFLLISKKTPFVKF